MKTLKIDPTLYPKANGSLSFFANWRLAWHTFTIYGGPFPYFTPGPGKFGINLRGEKQHPCDVYLPIADYGIPEQSAEKVAATLEHAVQRAMAGDAVYAGCMGGFGRTGLFLALVAKIMGVADPVGYIRANYTAHAVETDEQYRYVQDFPVKDIQKRLRSWAWKRRLRDLWPF